MNLMGAPVMDLIDNAAPPLPSPSTRVKIDPVIVTASLKLLAMLAASWPVKESATKIVHSSSENQFGFVPQYQIK